MKGPEAKPRVLLLTTNASVFYSDTSIIIDSIIRMNTRKRTVNEETINWRGLRWTWHRKKNDHVGGKTCVHEHAGFRYMSHTFLNENVFLLQTDVDFGQLVWILSRQLRISCASLLFLSSPHVCAFSLKYLWTKMSEINKTEIYSQAGKYCTGPQAKPTYWGICNALPTSIMLRNCLKLGQRCFFQVSSYWAFAVSMVFRLTGVCNINTLQRKRWQLRRMQSKILFRRSAKLQKYFKTIT